LKRQSEWQSNQSLKRHQAKSFATYYSKKYNCMNLSN
jgi:hypothetical protein